MKQEVSENRALGALFAAAATAAAATAACSSPSAFGC